MLWMLILIVDFFNTFIMIKSDIRSTGINPLKISVRNGISGDFTV